MPSAAKADLLRGPKRLDDVDFIFHNPRFEEREKTNGGLTAAFFIADLELNDGHQEETAWEIAPVDWLNDRDSGEPKAQVTEDGKFIDVDEQNPYQISGASEAGALFQSLEDNGISSSVMARLCAEPEVLEGVKVHGIQQATGRTYVSKKGARKGQTIEVTVLVAESVIEDPNTDTKKKTAAKAGAKPTAGAKPVGRPPRKPEPEPEPEEESTEEEGISELDQTGIDTVQKIFASVVSKTPREYVRTFSPRQYDGGVQIAQMGAGAMMAYKGKQPPKSNLVKILTDPNWAEQFAEVGGWTFDRKKGIYFPVTD